MANFSVDRTFTYTTHTNNSVGRVFQSFTRSQKTNFTTTTNFPAKDYPLLTPTKTISGIVYNVGGTPAVGVTVKLFRQVDDLLVGTSTTGTGGVYSFTRDASDPFTYYVLSYGTSTAPQVHGTSDRGQVPA